MGVKRVPAVFAVLCLACLLPLRKMSERPEPDVEVPAGDAKKGAKLFKAKCAQCHTCEPNGNNKQGPALHGVFGRASGTVDGFPYSEANQNSGIVWSSSSLALGRLPFLLSLCIIHPGLQLMRWS